MPDQIYVYSGTGNFYGQTFTVRGSWPPNIIKMWTDALAGSYTLQAPVWVPEYETITVSWPGEGGSLHSLVEPFASQFPTAATVQHLAELYGGTMEELPFFDGGGPISSNAVKRFLRFPSKLIEAWPLANAYTNNPPALADKMCQGLIASALIQNAALAQTADDVGAEDISGSIIGVVQLIPMLLQLIAAFQGLFGKHPKPAA